MVGGIVGNDMDISKDIEKMLASLKTQGGKGLSSTKLKKTKKADLVKMLESIDVMFDSSGR